MVKPEFQDKNLILRYNLNIQGDDKRVRGFDHQEGREL